ncbi:hypothetical protein I4F81_001390 [Pyropia yezoensis]|uniref:Uncharacterized protein n=1 Tax=Pyropia yezoensis TaxID=2788 RepID=A0ACC3BLF6_PYRYE|nr:hypothetical protein I4F81_001390 [Neopyropia yezoensis]
MPQALAGRDVLAAAPTGSGKTLAFAVPVLEALYRASWGPLDGLGAVVLAPTRELAAQIFDVFRAVGGRHDLSAALVTGGHDVGYERQRLGGINILVATPGRLLQHLDEAAELVTSGVKVLVLDEADRILDMGFAPTVDAIVANLPRAPHRQTLLFSATQTKSVRALARLSLSKPEYVEVLVHTYALVTAGTKLSTVWSFIKSHLKAKTLIFFATCKQVRFVYEAFRRLRPGVPLLGLHGRMSPGARADTYARFSAARGGAALFATDVAARGLDFPAVTWVLQADCPADVGAYVHRAGRTARYRSAGTSLTLLVGGREEGMVPALAAAAGVVATRTRINPSRLADVTSRLASAVAADGELRTLAQGALKSYVRAVAVAAAAVGEVGEEEVHAMAAAYGLPAAPIMRGKAPKGGAPPATADAAAAAAPAAPSDRLPAAVAGLGPAAAAAAAGRNVYGRSSGAATSRGGGAASRLVFDPDGRAVRPLEALLSTLGGGADDGNAGGATPADGPAPPADAAAAADARAARVARALAASAAEDRAAERERVRALHRARRDKERGRRAGGKGAAAGAEVEVTLGGGTDDDDDDDDDFGDDIDDRNGDDGSGDDSAGWSQGGGSEAEFGSGSDGGSDPDGEGGEGDDVASAEAAALAILNARRRR